ncbi:hypothetical protein HDV57DRAFT_233385 [Trichoderma longibrachiatum]
MPSSWLLILPMPSSWLLTLPMPSHPRFRFVRQSNNHSGNKGYLMRMVAVRIWGKMSNKCIWSSLSLLISAADVDSESCGKREMEVGQTESIPGRKSESSCLERSDKSVPVPQENCFPNTHQPNPHPRLKQWSAGLP